MTVERRRKLADEAHALAKDGNFSEAAEKYVRAGFEEAGQFFGRSSRGIELRMFFKASLCYRLAKQIRQSKFISNLAIELAREYIALEEKSSSSMHSCDQAELGAWYEFVGDLQVVAGLSDGTKAYDQAETIYKSAGDPFASFGEGPVQSVQAIFDDITLHSGADEMHVIKATEGTLTDWVEYKTEHLPRLLDIILSSKKWESGEN